MQEVHEESFGNAYKYHYEDQHISNQVNLVILSIDQGMLVLGEDLLEASYNDCLNLI